MLNMTVRSQHVERAAPESPLCTDYAWILKLSTELCAAPRAPSP